MLRRLGKACCPILDSREKKYALLARCPAALDNPSEVIGELVFFNDEKVLCARLNQPRRGLYDDAIKPGSIVVDGTDIVDDGSD
jgi:hypothetical protein